MTKNHQADPIVIDDGYSIWRHIKGIPRLHGDLTFKMRVLPPIPRQLMIADVKRFDGVELIKRSSKYMDDLISEWRFEGKPKSVESIQSLHFVLQGRLSDIVLWQTEGGDPLPDGFVIDGVTSLSADDPLPDWMKSGVEVVDGEKKTSKSP